MPVEEPETALVLAPYLSPRTREVLSARHINFADSTGNLRIVTSRPAIFLLREGATHDPNRAPRSLNSLRGAMAARVVRGLCELPLPVGVREFAIASGTSLGTVGRVIQFLETEALVTRDHTKRVQSVDRVALLQRWAQDYALLTSNQSFGFLEPRGLSVLWPKLGKLSTWAATGTLAGPGVAPARQAMIYVPDPIQAASALGLVAVDSGANVLLLEPYDDVVFERTRLRSAPGDSGAQLIIVSLAQAWADLFTGPGRGASEAEALLNTWNTEIEGG
jgi:hypothetical protein